MRFKNILRFKPNRIWAPFIALIVLGALAILPLRGQIIINTNEDTASTALPQWHVTPSSPRAGELVTVWIQDNQPWGEVRLTVNGHVIPLQDWRNELGVWKWHWQFAAPSSARNELVLYRDCHTGCIERSHLVLGTMADSMRANNIPTKLGVVFADPQRDWHSKSGWDVELTYARLSSPEHWGIDDLAARVYLARQKGLRVLVRVDYAKGQTLPPAQDTLALSEYLDYLQRLTRDERLRDVYGYIIGSGFNEFANNSLAPERLITPEWYARIFNGFGAAVSQNDNAMQVIRRENPQVRVLVGPVRPWNRDQDGARVNTINVPWLNYMNTLVAALDASAREKMAAGIPYAAPDGFAVNAPGQVNAAELNGKRASDEPRLDLKRTEWDGAQAGFRVYRDWLDIINRYPSTRGLPIFISATNTFAPDEGILPSENYPRGWLTSALDTINNEPQVMALSWFIDFDHSGDNRWDGFALGKGQGKMKDAAEEFDALLAR